MTHRVDVGAGEPPEDGLARALAVLHPDLTVEAHEGVAVLRLSVSSASRPLTSREDLVALARVHGFTHVALEV